MNRQPNSQAPSQLWSAQGVSHTGNHSGHGRGNPAPDASPSPVTTGDYRRAEVALTRR